MVHHDLFNNREKNLHTLIHTPQFFRISMDSDKSELVNLLNQNKHITIFDALYGQLRELIKLYNPTQVLTESSYESLIKEHLKDFTLETYGVWVYYPWSNRLVHVLDEEEFILVRTNRNTYKITPEERTTLSQKKVGVIGLSVGQSVALTMAMERSFGEIRLGDFDIIEMSNLNRIRTGLHNLNIKKTIVTAREIAEIDPFLKVTCYHEGITEENLDAFFTSGGMLDALIEECDSLPIKLQSRYVAKKFNIPVIMDTSDKGMIDIERFDLEPNRPIFHGLLSNFDLSKQNIENASKRMEILYAILEKEKISERFNMSIQEIGKTITTWPQLASSVLSGGANAADVYRRLMLGGILNSGRYYIDLEKIIL